MFLEEGVPKSFSKFQRKTSVLKSLYSWRLYQKMTPVLVFSWNTHALLNFVSSTNELENYSNKPFKQKFFQRLWKSKKLWRKRVMNCYEKFSADKESYILFFKSDSVLLTFLIIKIKLQILLRCRGGFSRNQCFCS